MTNEAILNAVFSKLASLGGLPAILYPNRKYSTPPTEYIAVSVMPIPTTTYSFDYGELKSGLIQCNVVVPIDVGVIKGAQIADTIITAMKNGTVIGGDLKVSKPPYSSGAIIDGASYIIPVTIQYRVVI
jgi:hypothetical protein